MNSTGRTLKDFWSSTRILPSKLPLDLSPSTWINIINCVVGLPDQIKAGDQMVVRAWCRYTNDTGIGAGVGCHIWYYDYNVPVEDRVWYRVVPSCGDNVEPKRHHLPLSIEVDFELPADWPEGHRVVVVLRADAHSSIAQPGMALSVEYGLLHIDRWSAG